MAAHPRYVTLSFSGGNDDTEFRFSPPDEIGFEEPLPSGTVFPCSGDIADWEGDRSVEDG